MQLSLEQAAERLGKSVRQWRYLIHTHALRANKAGGRWLIDAADLPLSEPQRAAVDRRERALREAVKHSLAEPLDNRLPTVFLGFRIRRAGIGPGPKALRRLRRRLRRADDLDPAHLARSLLAFRGMWGALGG